MSEGGKGREWGYASYDIDNPNDGLNYTSYELKGQ